MTGRRGHGRRTASDLQHATTTSAFLILCVGVIGMVGLGWPRPADAQSLTIRPKIISGYRSMQGPGDGTGPHRLQQPAASHYDVVAVRVEFQQDSSRFSTGDGTFEGILYEGTDPPRVDPLPHNAPYFSSHLLFLENYIRRVSDERTTISTHLLDPIIQLSGSMGEYAPTGMEANSDTELRKLAALVYETWQAVARDPGIVLPPDLDPDRTAFLIFHAGVGRDIELLGTTLDKTPEDLPSLYFSTEMLERLLPGVSTPVVDGFTVSNTLLIPRTETRRGIDFIQDKPFLAEFSINGMMAASFLNFLGVPDLFDSATGKSAIGPFGVMDGLGIFAYAGMLPPEPSAWTKAFLGWADKVDPGEGPQATVELEYAGNPGSNQMYEAPVSEAEYFLVENRNRDPEGDGVVLQVWNNGSISTVRFENGDPEFNTTTIRGFPGGVVVDADQFDFSLPGGRSEGGGFLNGGILIWHIDERRLRLGIGTNAVNTDSRRRAVDLEEADGAQDIGFPSQSFLGPSFDAGSPFDFFFEGNPVTVLTFGGQEIRLYENRFGPDTVPSSANNAGGTGFVELADFSLPARQMSFSVRTASVEGIARVPGLIAAAGCSTLDANSAVLEGIDDSYAATVFGRSDTGGFQIGFAGMDGRIDCSEPGFIASIPVVESRGVVAARVDRLVRVLPDLQEEMIAGYPGTAGVVRSITQVIAIGTGQDRSYTVGLEDENGPFLFTTGASGATIERLSSDLLGIAVGFEAELIVATRQDVRVGGVVRWMLNLGPGVVVSTPVFGRDAVGTMGLLPLVGTGEILVLEPDGSVSRISDRLHGIADRASEASPKPLLVDLDGDGELDILSTVDSLWIAVNRIGGMLPGFPMETEAGTTSRPVIAVAADGSPVIIALDPTGNMEARLTGSRRRDLSGFPLSVGLSVAHTPVLSENGVLAAVSTGGFVSAWQIDALERVAWGSVFGGRDNHNFMVVRDLTGPPISRQPLLVASETYNWPNPVRDGRTWIRFMTTETADIEIEIVDLAGRRVETLTRAGVREGIAAEVPWETDAGSGLYLARVKATSTSGRTESRLIKLAVIR